MEKEKKIGEWKELMVGQLTERIKENKNIMVSDYIGLAAEDVNELRRELETHQARYMVVKNSIAKIALKEAGLEGMADLVNGGTGIVFTGADSVAAAKVLSKFGKSHDSLKVRGGYLDGEAIDSARLTYLASLPGRDELIARVVYGIKSPISGFVGVLGNTLKGLLYVIQAIRDKNSKT